METQTFDCIIIGAGPAGIFTALELAEKKPEWHVLIVDSGRSIDKRTCPARKTGVCVHCNPCAILSGWSGAGAFSDGKLTITDEVGGHRKEYVGHETAREYINKADDIYVKFGASKEVYGKNSPEVDRISYEASKYNIRLIPSPVRHLGTEYAKTVLENRQNYLLNKTNTVFRELTTADQILTDEEGNAKGVTLTTQGVKGTKTVYSKHIVVAPGRGGAEWLTKEAGRIGLTTTNNEVDIGVRVECPNSVRDPLTKSLYEAKLVYYSDTYENKVRTFCRNPGGVVSEEHYEGGLAVVNGHSYGDKSKWTNNTNFALLVSNKFTEPFHEPILYGQNIAKLANRLTGGPIRVQRLGDLLLGRRTTKSRLEQSTVIPTLKNAVPGDLSFVLPDRILTSIVEALKALDHLAPGLYSKNTLLYGVEVKFYSSKVDVDHRFRTKIKGLYAIGDGAGITRGLRQASATGIYVADDRTKE